MERMIVVSVPEIILDFACAYGIDPDTLFVFSCFYCLGVIGGLSVMIDIIINLLFRFARFVRGRIRSLMGKANSPA